MAVEPSAIVRGLDEPRLEAIVGPADAKAFELHAGELLQILDVEGEQVSDLVAFHAHDREARLSTTVTRALVEGLFPLPGQGLYDHEGGLLLTLLEDTVGRHDTFVPACNREVYEALGYPDHVNCTDNFNRELAAFGHLPRRFFEVVNWFYNTTVGPDGRVIESEPPLSKAGDYVLLRAERDLVAAASACPDEITPTNGFKPTPVLVRVFAPAA
jgi:glycine cleavage system T protein (aminomethyltransferase)